jgi:hypothetical protein
MTTSPLRPAETWQAAPDLSPNSAMTSSPGSGLTTTPAQTSAVLIDMLDYFCCDNLRVLRASAAS